jgi:hypothetical protein
MHGETVKITNALYTEHIIGSRLKHRCVIRFEIVAEEYFVCLECLVVTHVQSRQSKNTYKAMAVCCKFFLIPVRTQCRLVRSNTTHEINKAVFKLIY